MAKVLVLYYATYGHIELDGARHQGQLIAQTAQRMFDR